MSAYPTPSACPHAESEPVNPFAADRAQLIARCRAMAVKAKRSGQPQTYRCPACLDLAWVYEQGTTVGGNKAEVARRCTGPTASGCPQIRYDDEQRARKQQVASGRGRMD